MFIYIYIYIYTYCKLDHLSPFMLLMINICRPDLLNCFWIMPREKNLSKWKWLHLARYTTSSFAHSTILPHSIATIAGIGRPMGCHKQTTNAKNRGHAREVSSILIGSGCFMWDIHRYPATKTGHLFYFASRPWKQYELKQAVFLVKFCCDLSCFMLVTLTESWQSGFARWVFFCWIHPERWFATIPLLGVY